MLGVNTIKSFMIEPSRCDSILIPKGEPVSDIDVKPSSSGELNNLKFVIFAINAIPEFMC